MSDRKELDFNSFLVEAFDGDELLDKSFIEVFEMEGLFGYSITLKNSSFK